MKHTARMKKVEITIVVACLGVLGSIVGPMFVGPFYIRHRFTPREKTATIAQLEKDFGVRLEARRVAVRGVYYTFARGPLVSWGNVPSGPPMYIFDSQGHLVDYTLDVGDDPRFADKWIHGTTSNRALQPTETR
ncbi:MAG: hypothetical protein HY318_13960 [Armatimonadetes bacterium]|nr:hypothetical protein [Armatimonadota bacterium]